MSNLKLKAGDRIRFHHPGHLFATVERVFDDEKNPVTYVIDDYGQRFCIAYKHELFDISVMENVETEGSNKYFLDIIRNMLGAGTVTKDDLIKIIEEISNVQIPIQTDKDEGWIHRL